MVNGNNYIGSFQYYIDRVSLSRFGDLLYRFLGFFGQDFFGKIVFGHL